MKRITALLIAIALLLLAGCGNQQVLEETTKDLLTSKTETEQPVNLEFTGLGDENLLQYVNDCVYSETEALFDNDDYQVYDVNSIYISKEYLEEVEFNSQENIYFGYTLSELNEFFDGTKYVFTLGEDGKTTVKPSEDIDYTYEKTLLKNVAIGTGVILICATVSVATAGVGTGAVSVVFAASANTAAHFAVSSSIFGGVLSAIAKGIETKDFNEAIKAGALGATEGFKWGAISGALVGGGLQALNLHKINSIRPTPRQAELQILDKYPGQEQIAFLDGIEVDPTTLNSTRPDIIRVNPETGVTEAIEVKSYDLTNKTRVKQLCEKLLKQVTDRVNNLPSDYTQRIVLNTVGQDLTETQIEYAITSIEEVLAPIYPDIPIDVFSYAVA